MVCIIPPVHTSDDLLEAIEAAAGDDSIRWYPIRKADAMRRLDLLPTDWPVTAASREFSTEVRERYAKEGIALSDGSYPIPDKDALRRAVMAFGRSNPEDRSKVRRHIIKRARALGATDMIPDDWKATTSSAGVADGEDGEDDPRAGMYRLQMEALRGN